MTDQRVEVLNAYIWGERVGAVAPAGRSYAFEYTPAWRRRRIELAPVLMPTTSRRRIFSFPGLSEETYRGLPPMLADAVPDQGETPRGAHARSARAPEGRRTVVRPAVVIRGSRGAPVHR